MREFSRVSPMFWTGDTGKKLRAAGRDAQIVALYLMTCPSANMLGLYYLPMPTLIHEIGSPFEGASKALRRVSEAGFAFYDADSEHVWVPEMARWQIGASLDAKDKRVTGVIRELETLRKSPFFNEFLRKYREPFHLHDVPEEPSPFEGASMPLRSQEQEQEQEQEQYREPDSAGKRRPTLSEFALTDPLRNWCRENKISITTAENELPKFKDWHRAKGKKIRDPAAAFRNWLRKSKEFNSNGHSPGRSTSRPSGLQEIPVP